MNLRSRRWEKPFRWQTAKDGKVDLSEVEQVVNQLVRLGSEMSFQMMSEMVAGNTTHEEFCNAQNSWNRYLFDRAMPSSNGEPAPALSERKPTSTRPKDLPSSDTDLHGQKTPLKKGVSAKPKSPSRSGQRKR